MTNHEYNKEFNVTPAEVKQELAEIREAKQRREDGIVVCKS